VARNSQRASERSVWQEARAAARASPPNGRSHSTTDKFILLGVGPPPALRKENGVSGTIFLNRPVEAPVIPASHPRLSCHPAKPRSANRFHGATTDARPFAFVAIAAGASGRRANAIRFSHRGPTQKEPCSPKLPLPSDTMADPPEHGRGARRSRNQKERLGV